MGKSLINFVRQATDWVKLEAKYEHSATPKKSLENYDDGNLKDT